MRSDLILKDAVSGSPLHQCSARRSLTSDLHHHINHYSGFMAAHLFKATQLSKQLRCVLACQARTALTFGNILLHACKLSPGGCHICLFLISHATSSDPANSIIAV